MIPLLPLIKKEGLSLKYHKFTVIISKVFKNEEIGCKEKNRKKRKKHEKNMFFSRKKHEMKKTFFFTTLGGGFRGTYRPTCYAASTLSLWVFCGRRGTWAPCISNILGL